MNLVLLLLALKIKQPVIFTSKKMGLFRNSKELKFRTRML